ncbi:MAG: GNAT family N-acetyltransferase [Chloroflexi bacterium]|nr:GNAT family N-acetyltransferase [Chloroflexota bacterium]
MTQQQEITVRRAKPSDAGKIAAFVNNAWHSAEEINERTVIERFGTVGFLLAERDNELIGMLGWQVENLVVGLTDFLINPASERITIGQALLADMERFADELQCEAALMFLPHPTPPALIEFCKTLQYESRTIASLVPAWQITARERGLGDDDTVMIKKLSDRRVLRPM